MFLPGYLGLLKHFILVYYICLLMKLYNINETPNNILIAAAIEIYRNHTI